MHNQRGKGHSAFGQGKLTQRYISREDMLYNPGNMFIHAFSSFSRKSTESVPIFCRAPHTDESYAASVDVVHERVQQGHC